jgi:glycosyltransferase involved in cell wall biosynthesis
MAQSPYFSVIIPAHNRADLLRQALTSVFAQGFSDFEAIVVDDGSTEDLSPVADEYQGRVLFLRQKNAGPSAARNYGLSKAAGDYVAFLDSDDMWFPWTLHSYRKAIDENGRPAFVAGSPRIFQHLAELNAVASAPVEALRFGDYLASGDRWRWFGVSSFVIRRDAVVSCGGFPADMRYGEDADLALRLGVSAGFVQVISPVTFGYRQGGAEQLTANWRPQLPAVERLLASEREGKYPGGRERAKERQRIISRHVRPVALALLREREFAAAWNLYWSLLPWNLRLRKWKFMLGFIVHAVLQHTVGRVKRTATR